MDIIFIESRGKKDLFSKTLEIIQRFAGSTEVDREHWWSHVVIRADSVRMPDGDQIIWESAWDSPFLRMNYWSRYSHRRYRVYRDKANLQTLGSVKEKTCKKLYGYLQILGYLPIVFMGRRLNLWPGGEVCVETAHRWCLEHGYEGVLAEYEPDVTWPVLLEDLLRRHPDFKLVESSLE